MKFLCKRCGDPCFIEFEDDCEFTPTHCPFDGELDAVWRKLEKKALPKLTVEELERRGIEWPEWAVCVVVSPSEWGLFASKVPSLSVDKAYWIGGGLTLSIASGKWDATDWQNSKIMRPEKATCSAEHEDFSAGESKLELDENRFTLDGVEYEAVEAKGQAWFDNSCRLCDAIKRCGAVPVACGTQKRKDGKEVYWRRVKKSSPIAIGSYAKCGDFIGKVDWLSRDGSECRITCGESRFAKTGEVKPVTWRAWNDAEMKRQVGRIYKGKQYGHFLLVTESGCRPDGSKTFLFVGAGSIGQTADEVFEKYTQLNGLPCGEPVCD